MHRLLRPFLIGFVLLAGFGPSLQAAPPSKEDQELFDRLVQRLLAKMERVEGYDVWPPDIRLVDSDDEKDPRLKVNAYAWLDPNQPQKKVPIIRFMSLYFTDVFNGDPVVIAHTLAHELGHIYHGHVLRSPRNPTDFVRRAIQREREYEADAFGAALMRKAGFSVLEAVMRKAQYLRDANYNLHHATLDELKSTHPAWDNRFARVVQNPLIWQMLSTFNNGVALLSRQQFYLAEQCFKKVVEFDPLCYEAQVNLGYARLMQYCDRLTVEELRDMGVGQISCTAFYRRAKTLEPILRGKNREVWLAACAAFRDARRLRPNLALAHANLGLAYLVHPGGKDLETALAHLELAQECLEEDKTLSPLDRAALLVNLGTAYLATGGRKEGFEQFVKAKKGFEQLVADKKLVEQDVKPYGEVMLYNEARTLGTSEIRDEKLQAFRMFERYLTKGSSLSTWWTLAYEEYEALAKELGQTPQKQEIFEKTSRSTYRTLLTVNLTDGKTVTLGEKIDDVLKRLGKPSQVEDIQKHLQRYRFEKQAIELLATDRVIAIILDSTKSPALTFVAKDVGMGKSLTLRVGLSRKEVYAKFPGATSPVSRYLTSNHYDSVYAYYPELGLALAYDAGYPKGNVSELILVQMH